MIVENYEAASAAVAVEFACTRQVMRFFEFWDQHDADRLGDLFTEDALFDRAGTRLEGRNAIVAAAQERPKSLLGRHVASNLRFSDVSATRASVELYVTAYLAQADEPGPVVQPIAPHPMLLDFTFDFEAGEGGWRIVQCAAHLAIMFRKADPERNA